MDWLEAADEYRKLAQQAGDAGDMVVLIAAIQRAAECLQIARNLDGLAETRAQLDELAQQAEGSHRQHMERDNG